MRPCLDCGAPYEPRRGVARCPQHQREYRRTREAPLSTAAWRALRARKLKRNPICEDCGRQWAVQVQHIVPRSMGGALLPPLSGLRALCVACHAVWTNRERRWGYRPPPTVVNDDDEGPRVA